jgi:hypothetical protein
MVCHSGRAQPNAALVLIDFTNEKHVELGVITTKTTK